MKKYQLHTKTEDTLSRFPALCKRMEGAELTPQVPGAPRVLCLGADLEKDGACLAVQCGLCESVSPGTLTRETILSLMAALRARGWRCVIGLEACGFGWRFQRQLREAGAESLTFATEALTGRRKTNTRDAAALAPRPFSCRHLSRTPPPRWWATASSTATPGPAASSANPRRRNSSAAF